MMKTHEQKSNRTLVQCIIKSLLPCNLQQVFDVMQDNMAIEIYCNFYLMRVNYDR